MKPSNISSLLAACLLGGFPFVASAEAPAIPPPLPSAIKHWQDLRFGMFIHWGPVSLTAQEIGWSRGAQTPIEKYDNLYKEFNPTKFNADEWVSIAKAGGMKYIVLTTKHHDGFCLWDTKLTDYNIMNSPFKRDVVKELSAACKKQGIGFGTYYSVCDWHHPDFPLTSPGGGVRRPKFNLDAYNTYLLGQMKELVVNYGPLLTMWNDVPQEFGGRGIKSIKMLRELQPDIVINDRTGDGGDYSTPEQTIGGFNMDRPWESCMTISASGIWAWGGDKDGVKPLDACLEMLIRGAGGNGNVLLNVGPRPDGVIDPAQAGRLKEMGDWLAKNGESIYATRGGPWKPNKTIVSTRKDNLVYLHLLRWNGTPVVVPNLPKKIIRSSSLSGRPATVKTTPDGIVIEAKGAATDGQQEHFDTIIKLELDGSAMDIAPITLTNLKPGLKASASNVFQNMAEYGPEQAFDGDPATRWATDGGTKQAWLQIDLGKPQTIARVMIDEWSDAGSRVRSFELQTQEGNEWKTFHKGTAIGTKWEKSFPPFQTRCLRLNILDASEGPTIKEWQVLPQ